MDFSPEARSVLGILNSLEHKKTLSTLETISNHIIDSTEKRSPPDTQWEKKGQKVSFLGR